MMRQYCHLILSRSILDFLNLKKDIASIKGQCLDSLKSVCLPDSIAEQIENNYEDKYTNASKNVVNLISPNNYNFVDGIYAFKGMGPHFPRQIFVYKREKIFIFNSRGDYNPEGVIMEFCSCIKKLNLTHKEIVDYLNQ